MAKGREYLNKFIYRHLKMLTVYHSYKQPAAGFDGYYILRGLGCPIAWYAKKDDFLLFNW